MLRVRRLQLNKNVSTPSKTELVLAKVADSDEMRRSVTPHLGLYCLLKYPFTSTKKHITA